MMSHKLTSLVSCHVVSDEIGNVDECISEVTNLCATTENDGVCTDSDSDYDCSCSNDFRLGRLNECVGK